MSHMSLHLPNLNHAEAVTCRRYFRVPIIIIRIVFFRFLGTVKCRGASLLGFRPVFFDSLYTIDGEN